MFASKSGRMLWLLIPLVLALPFAMDIYVPAVPGMTRYFHTTPGVMQLTLNMFMLVSGITQMLVGPMADHFGRRNLTLGLAFLFTIGCGVCAAADHVSVLILGRIIQALGSCGMLAIAFIVSKDMFAGVRLARSCSQLNMIIACSPMFAPFVGGYMYVFLGWRANFIFLLAMGLLTYVACFFYFPETMPEKQPMNKGLVQLYLSMLKDRCFCCYAAAGAFGLTYIFLFCALSPVILIAQLGVPETQYGYYFAFMGVSFLLGSAVANVLVSRVGIYRTVVAGFVLSLIGGVVMLVWYQWYGMSRWGFVLPMLIIGSGGSCSMSAGSAGAVSHITCNTGTASALCTGIRFLFAALMGLVASRYVHSGLPLSLSAVVLSLLGLCVFTARRNDLLAA